MNGCRHYSSWLIVTRHFYRAFFRLSFLDDAGEESFKRAIAGMLAGIVAFGLLLARVYSGKYQMLGGQATPDLYRWMLPADQLLMICLAMCGVAFVMALVSHSIFPDETDFRILMALPISRLTVFAGKLTALFGFAAVFIGGANIGLGLPFVLVSTGRWAEDALVARAAAQVLAGTLASLFAVAAIVTVQGLVIVFAPRAWLRTVSLAMQTSLICGLVLALPIVARVPAVWPYLRARPSSLLFVPPVWFLGLQRWLLGDSEPYVVRLAGAAILGTAIVVGIGAACYVVIYRRFDQIAFRASSGKKPLRWNIHFSLPFDRHPAHQAVQAFVAATLRRSGLHQLVFLGALAVGLALAADRVAGAIHLPERWLISAALGAPLTVIVAAVLGLRAALRLPASLRAAWIFQLTEQADSRRHCMNAVRHAVIGTSVILPAALAFPLHAGLLGFRTACACLPVVVLLGVLFVEIVFIWWRRIPFTCTVLFGKRPAAFTLLVFVSTFGAFVVVGTLFLQAASSGLAPWLIIVTTFALALAALRWHRTRTSGVLPFEFADYRPDALSILVLR